MKIAVTGKGGVGKTTVAILLSNIFVKQGKKVLLIDADPDADLAITLGIPEQIRQSFTPISEMKDLIEERTGVKKGTLGGFFKLNPKVDDLFEKFAYKHNKISLITLGGIKAGGSGCYCPENVLLKRLIEHLVSQPDKKIILDMEAGIEHLTRGTAKFVDILIIVVEPDIRSLKSAVTIKKLASEIGVRRIFVIGNKIRNNGDKKLIVTKIKEIPILGFISYNHKILSADLEKEGLTLIDDSVLQNELNDIESKLFV
ncbi:carbon monoxide dehydrogenase [Candidatus Atribacteria bacterium HGW-Atribacteria-1]|nr:MAG: carbon monoxide dehydrogenase [Candidatus Atribacteria bacterium HGW-Atribacteria-1]